MKKNINGNELAKLAMDEIPTQKANAKEITAVVKENRKVTGYEIADEFVSKNDAINMAKNGELKNVGIAHNKNTQYLKSVPDGINDNNLTDLPVKSNK